MPWDGPVQDSWKSRTQKKLMRWPCTSLTKVENEEERQKRFHRRFLPWLLCVCQLSHPQQSLTLPIHTFWVIKRKRKEAHYISIYQHCCLSLLYDTHTHTHSHTCIYIYIYIYVCACVCPMEHCIYVLTNPSVQAKYDIKSDSSRV